MTIFAVIGITALWLFFGWLACAIAASYLSGRKGYGERPGLAAGLILAPIGVLIFLFAPAKEGSDWKVIGPFGRQKQILPPEGDADQPAAPQQQ